MFGRTFDKRSAVAERDWNEQKGEWIGSGSRVLEDPQRLEKRKMYQRPWDTVE